MKKEEALMDRRRAVTHGLDGTVFVADQETQL